MEGGAMKIKVSKPFMTSDHAEVKVYNDSGFSIMRTGLLNAKERAELRQEMVKAIAELDKFPKVAP
jgi:hypothetical protein